METAPPMAGHQARRPARFRERAAPWVRLLVVMLLLPAAAFALTGKIERSDRPRWRWGAYDPQFAYLLDSINIAEGHAPGVYHHPGTPLQVLGATLLTTRHAARAPGVPLRQDVLADPIAALDTIGLTLRLLHAAALGALGIAALRLTGTLACALAAQGLTLLSLAALRSVHRVAPESLLTTIGLVLAASVMMCLSRPHAVRARFGVISGVLVALGVGAKVTFAPACLAVWGVLAGSRPRALRPALLHAAVLPVALVVVLAPILGRLPEMGRWFGNIAARDGLYGRSGGHLIVNLGEYPGQLWLLVAAEPVLAGAALAGAALWGALLIPALARRLDEQARRARTVLGAVAAAQLLQFVVVAKHMTPRYMVTAVALMGLSACLAFVLTRAAFPRSTSRRIAAALALVGLGWGAVHTFRGVRDYLEGRNILSAEQVALALAVQPLEAKPGRPGSGAVLVYTYWSSSPAYALHMGNHWAGFRFGDDLMHLFPDRVLYAPRSPNRYTDSRMAPVAPGTMEAWAAEGRLYFHMREDELPDAFLYDTVIASQGMSGGLFRARVP